MRRKHCLQLAGGELGGSDQVRRVGEGEAGFGERDHRQVIVDDDAAGRLEREFTAFTHELPAIDRARGWKSIVDALVLGQLLRRRWSSARLEVCRTADD